MRKTKLIVKATTQFKKDYKLATRRGLKMELLDEVITALSTGKTLSEKYRDHPLTGNWTGQRECNILTDWLIVYRIEEDVLVLTLSRTGNHSDLFGK
ncbi:MAG: type II toxin-antitoxin system YafQ family toxin [Lachnospiraceae bacterium]|nr:type II toxin-antitoxin system YafQ family toxin [Lachnospiraceae bacterium]